MWVLVLGSAKLKTDHAWAVTPAFIEVCVAISWRCSDRFRYLDDVRFRTTDLDVIVDPGWIGMAGSGRGFLLVSQRLGQLAQVLGDHARALAHFEQARRQGRDLSAGLIVAWADLETAATLLDRNGPGDQAKSAQLIDSVAEFAQGRGLGLIEQRIAALRGDRHGGLAFAV